jgi:hypothetical protein
VATHNHSGPPLGLLIGEAPPDAAYINLLISASVRAACLALEGLRPVRLFLTEQRLPGLTYNRRALLPDGRVSIAPVPDLPVVERGPLDDRLTVLLLRDYTGNNLAGLVHYACHGVAVLSQAIGADIPGELSERVGALLGAPCLFLQGAAGDVNPTAVTAGRPDLLAWVERAMEPLKDLNGRFHPVLSKPFKALTYHLPLSYAPLPGLQEVEREVRYLERIAAGEVDSPDLQDALRSFRNTMNMQPQEPMDPHKARFVALALAEAGRKTMAALHSRVGLPPQTLGITVWRLGGLLLVFLAAEIFSTTGLQIRDLAPDLTVLPVSYLAPLLGYLPDPASLRLGGYEVSDAWRFYGHPAPFASDSEPRLLKRVAQMVKEEM